MKRGLLGFPLLIFLTQIISAQFLGGSGSFSLSYFFDRIDPSTITLGLLFLIFFAFIFYVLSRVFRNKYGETNKGVAGIIAFAASFLIIYGIHRSGFSLGDLFYNLGIDTSIFYLIASIILIIGAIFLIKKFKFSGFLTIFGLFLILLVILTDLFYDELPIVIIGIILFLIGLWLLRRRRRRLRGGSGRKPKPLKEPKSPRKSRRPRPTRETGGGGRTPPGEASLDVIAGGRNLGGTGNVTLDLRRNNSTIIYIKNGGTGGTLGWRASSHRALGLSGGRGRLRVGQTYALTVTVTDRGGRQNPAVIITGRGAGRTGGRATRGRVLIYFRVR